MKIVVINGPNLNLLGKREPSIYGDKSLEDLQSYLIKVALENKIEVDFFQRNIEGNIVDCIQQANKSGDEIGRAPV